MQRVSPGSSARNLRRQGALERLKIHMDKDRGSPHPSGHPDKADAGLKKHQQERERLESLVQIS